MASTEDSTINKELSWSEYKAKITSSEDNQSKCESSNVSLVTSDSKASEVKCECSDCSIPLGVKDLELHYVTIDYSQCGKKRSKMKPTVYNHYLELHSGCSTVNDTIKDPLKQCTKTVQEDVEKYEISEINHETYKRPTLSNSNPLQKELYNECSMQNAEGTHAIGLEEEQESAKTVQKDAKKRKHSEINPEIKKLKFTTLILDTFQKADITTAKADALPAIDNQNSLNSVDVDITAEADASRTVDNDNNLNSVDEKSFIIPIAVGAMVGMCVIYLILSWKKR